MKAISRILGLFALLATLVGCDTLSEEISVSLNKGLISNLPVGREQALIATVAPIEFMDALTWSSSDEAIAVVSNKGVVKGIAPGEAVITAKVGESSATCKVIVTAVKPTSITLSLTELELEVDGTFQLEYTLGPDFATADDVQWSSADDKVATVEDGLVKGLSVGETVITVKCNGNTIAATCQVSVLGEIQNVAVENIELTEEMALSVGAEMSIVWNVLPANATNKNVELSVEGDCITVDAKGKVTALKPGEAVVTVSATDGSGVKAECRVTVTEEVSVKAVLVTTPNGTDLQVDETLQLAVSFLPENATPVSVSWTLSDTDYEYAEVDQNGLMKGLATESFLSDPENSMSPSTWKKVVVTVTADGVSGNATIRVIPKQPKAIALDLPQNNSIRVNEKWSFNPRVLPEELGYTVYCSSSLPGGRVDNEAYTPFSSEVPGVMNITFAVSGNDNIVPEYMPANQHVSVAVNPYWVESVSIPETYELEAGSSVILHTEFTSDVEGVQPTYKDLKWTSSDPTIAAINEKNGEILALAPGTVEITATTANDWSVPNNNNPKSATCVLTVKAAAVPLNVGDYYYSDGTWSTELDPAKTVIGVVFSRTNAASSDDLLAKDYPGCTHGLVLSTQQYVVPCATDRDWSRSALIDWMGTNGYNQLADFEKYCGYNNTQGIIAANAAQIESNGDVVRIDYASAVLQHREAVNVPDGASPWFIPSYLEMVTLAENLDVVNAALVGADGDALKKIYEYEFNTRVFEANQHYYYSNNVTNDYIHAFDMNERKTVTPTVTISYFDKITGEKTELPVLMVLAF